MHTKFNELTETVAMHEGKKQPVNIAQIKEVTRIVLTELANLDETELARLLKRYKRA